MANVDELILIIDFGSQYTQLIARRVREQNVYCEIVPCTADLSSYGSNRIKGYILSGGPASLKEPDSPRLDRSFFDTDKPVLGICYGMQLMADALGGVVCGPKNLIRQIHHYREITGATLDPMAAYLLLRGMKTLHLRIRQQNASALQIGRFLEAQPQVSRVFYPGLSSHPQHEIARRQMNGFGGVLSFMLKENSFDAVRRLLPRLRYAHCAANLGAVETIVGPPATTSHVECTAQERARMGIPESLVRYSTGIEDTADLIADLEQALAVF